MFSGCYWTWAGRLGGWAWETATDVPVSCKLNADRLSERVALRQCYSCTDFLAVRVEGVRAASALSCAILVRSEHEAEAEARCDEDPEECHGQAARDFAPEVDRGDDAVRPQGHEEEHDVAGSDAV